MRRLGIVIPAYTVAFPLKRLLQQIEEQLTDDVAVVVVDDGSSDNTLQVAKQFESEAVRVLHKENGGVGSARNLGIEECDSEYIWFVDADDGIAPNAIAILLKAIGKSARDCYLFGFDKLRGKSVETIVNSEAKSYDTSREMAGNFDHLFGENLLNPLWNKLFRKEIIEREDLRFSSIPSGEDAEFVLRFLSHAQSMDVLTDVLYRYRLLSDTSSAHKSHPDYIGDHRQMFMALTDYCDETGASAMAVKTRWAAETAMGFRWNVFNGLEGKGKYRQFSKEVKLRQPEMEALLASLGDCPRQGWLRGLVARSIPLSYLFIKTRLFVANIQGGVREVMNNPGVLPKVLVATIRFGMWTEHICPRILGLPFRLLHRLVELLFCKLLLNCDISVKAEIGQGLTIYHPYGIFVNSGAKIGSDFTCRAYVTIGNKGTDDERDGCPTIGDGVNVGVGAKIIGPITVGSNCSIGANAVVTHSFADGNVLVGIPAKAI